MTEAARVYARPSGSTPTPRGCTFFVPGEPRGKGRPRAARFGNHIRVFTDAKTISYESLVAHEASCVMKDWPPFQGPMLIMLRVTFAVPKSASNRKRSLMLAGTIRPTRKPDMSNVLKSIEDGCNGIVFTDDAHVVKVSMEKVYGERPGVMATILALSAEAAP